MFLQWKLKDLSCLSWHITSRSDWLLYTFMCIIYAHVQWSPLGKFSGQSTSWICNCFIITIHPGWMYRDDTHSWMSFIGFHLGFKVKLLPLLEDELLGAHFILQRFYLSDVACFLWSGSEIERAILVWVDVSSLLCALFQGWWENCLREDIRH